MKVRIFTEPQMGASYDTLLSVARAAEEFGFDAFFRSDHYLHYSPVGLADGLPGPTDAWITLAGLARETTRIRLGTLVSPATFRLPGPLAIQVAQVDVMSGGRVELGLGAGWFAPEHTAYGIPFPDRRFDRFEEQLEILTGLWRTPVGASFSFAGRYYRLEDSPALPKPVQTPHPPLVIGGAGLRRTPRMAARYANEFNVLFQTPDQAATSFERVRDACREFGRDPRSLACSAGSLVICGRSDAELARRAGRIGRTLDDELRAVELVGTPDQLVERIKTFEEAGADRLYLQVLDLHDIDHLELIGSEVLRQL